MWRHLTSQRFITSKPYHHFGIIDYPYYHFPNPHYDSHFQNQLYSQLIIFISIATTSIATSITTNTINSTTNDTSSTIYVAKFTNTIVSIRISIFTFSSPSLSTLFTNHHIYVHHPLIILCSSTPSFQACHHPQHYDSHNHSFLQTSSYIKCQTLVVSPSFKLDCLPGTSGNVSIQSFSS